MNTKHSFDQLFGWLLFAFFAICSLALVASGAGNYKRSAQKMSTTSSAVIVSYLTEKFRHADSKDIVLQDTQTIRILQDIGEQECELWIYVEDGKLCESTLPVGREPVRGAGNPIAQIENFSIEREDRILRFSVTDSLGEERTRLYFAPGKTGDHHE